MNLRTAWRESALAKEILLGLKYARKIHADRQSKRALDAWLEEADRAHGSVRPGYIPKRTSAELALNATAGAAEVLSRGAVYGACLVASVLILQDISERQHHPEKRHDRLFDFSGKQRPECPEMPEDGEDLCI